MRAGLTLILPAAVLVLAAACGESIINISSDGQIQVTVSTTGTDVDSDGFTVSVDGGTTQFVAPGGQVTLTGLEPGSHSVRLTGLAENCLVVGGNPKGVRVGSDGRATVAFEVTCVRATTGGFTIALITVGAPADTDGYRLAVAGADDIRSIASNATEIFTGLAPGGHLVTLKDVDPGCRLVGGNPQLFAAVPGKTLLVRLTVSCGTPT